MRPALTGVADASEGYGVVERSGLSVSGSSPTARWVAAATLLLAAAAAGCDGYRGEVWVRNMTDRTYALLLAIDDGPDRLAFVEIVPASEGLAHQRAGQSVASFVLFNADCRPVAGGAIKGPRTTIVIDEGGVALDDSDVIDTAVVLANMRPGLAYQEVGDCRDPLG
jgi:hypothetical protein